MNMHDWVHDTLTPRYVPGAIMSLDSPLVGQTMSGNCEAPEKDGRVFVGSHFYRVTGLRHRTKQIEYTAEMVERIKESLPSSLPKELAEAYKHILDIIRANCLRMIMGD
jgi:hypothetical protein